MKRRLTRSIICIICIVLFSAALFSQNSQNRGQQSEPAAANAKPTPRKPDGKPILAGTWVGGAQATGGQLSPQFGGKTTMELTKWGAEKYEWNRGPESANAEGVYRGQTTRVDQDPIYHCYPPGLVRLGPPTYVISGGSGAGPVLMDILETPGQLVIVYQYRNSIRRIYTDGREHPKILQLTWNGHSIGNWDGDTFVVDTVGLRDESWLDTGGHEHSPKLHVVERFRRTDEDHLEIERTLTDPVAIAKPFTATVTLRLRPNLDINENMDGRQYDCTQFMVRKPAFGEGENGLLGIFDHP